MAYVISATTYRAMNTPREYFRTMQTSSILPLSKRLLVAKRIGRYSLPPLTMLSSLNPETLTKPTDCPGVQIIKRG